MAESLPLPGRVEATELVPQLAKQRTVRFSWSRSPMIAGALPSGGQLAESFPLLVRVEVVKLTPQL